MKVSYNQLQTYFADKLPMPEKLAEAVTFGVFEIEGMEKVAGQVGVDGKGDDIILDIKVLPDRANYAKSVDGIVREISAVCNMKRKPGMAVAPAPRAEKISVTVSAINQALGTDISAADMIAILERMDIGVEQRGDELVLSVPSDRTDLQTWRDIPEEIGRMYGYNNIAAVLPKNMLDRKMFAPVIEKTFYYCEKIRNVLLAEGFSEIYGYSLVPKGDYEIEKSVAADKNYLRMNLAEGMLKLLLDTNLKNADLLSVDEIKMFEIGKVFPAAGEHLSFAFGIKNTKKKQEKEQAKIQKVLEQLNAAIGVKLPQTDIAAQSAAYQYEINLDEYIAGLPEPKSYADLNLGPATSLEYKKFSLQPFIRRDIAVWVPAGVDEASVKNVIEVSLAENTKVTGIEIKIIGDAAFDTFSKDGKTSYAFGMTFQSYEKTLTDDKVNAIMNKVYEVVKAKGWEVR